MTESTLIAKYEKGISKVALHIDRVEFGVFNPEQYTLDSVTEVVLESNLSAWKLRFIRNAKPSSNVFMEAKEAHVFQHDLRDHLLKNQDCAPSSLLASLPIMSFYDGASAVIIYSDRIAQRPAFGLSVYQISEIREVKIERRAFMWGVWLVMYNGTTSSRVQLGQEKTKACHQFIEKHLRDYREVSNAGPVVVMKCSALGGSGISVKQGALCTVKFGDTVFQFKSDDYQFELRLAQLTSFEIDDPGRVENSAGVAGGGFGVQGALVGMGVAALVNTLTARSTINTFLHLTWMGGELFLHSSSYTPQQARIMLSHDVFAALQPRSLPQTTETTVIQQRNGLTYIPNETTPFTGVYITTYPNGHKRSERNYKDGKLDGLVTSWTWYENGQKESEGNYKDGKQEGLETLWDENGQKESESNYKDGKKEGLATLWKAISKMAKKKAW